MSLHAFRIVIIIELWNISPSLCPFFPLHMICIHSLILVLSIFWQFLSLLVIRCVFALAPVLCVGVLRH